MLEGTTSPFRRYLEWLGRRPWRILAVGGALALSAAALVMAILMQPPIAELAALVRTLAITSILSLFLGFLLYRRGLARLPSLTLTLVIAYGWAALLTLVNVLVMAGLMFVSEHDLALSIVLLLFAAIIATSYGMFVAASVTDNLRELARTAQEVAEGNLRARVQVVGRDEVAQASHAFNAMAEQLQSAAQERRAVEELRRDLIAWTSHDLRTPLTSIRAMVEALHDGVVSDEESLKRYYRTIRADVLSLNALIDDLFELAQLEAGGLKLEVAPHSISDLISDALESFQALAEKRNVSLEGSVEGDIDPIVMNPPKIGRVISNLISNAIQYTPRGGIVRVGAWRDDAGVCVTVEDSGPGFAQEDLARVFEQFYRGEEARSRKTGGAGLGLAIAQAVIDGHGGKIWAENRPDGGACVGFLLPDKVASNAS
ncbi:MAG TPA: HAMP domain-containing sensor histidine kinase [Candidatus Binatia bacterium]|nr:HAMP domain-containing sensor histidine kinase [Candidatus Binatia bacterium]